MEFCAHITRAFAVSLQPTKLLRAEEALAYMGSSVSNLMISNKHFFYEIGHIPVGMTSTSHSLIQIIKILYFSRLLLKIFLLGFVHNLMVKFT